MGAAIISRQETHIPLRAHLALVLSSLLWGSGFVVIKIAFRFFSPLSLVFLRLSLGFLIFLVIHLVIFVYRPSSIRKFRIRVSDWPLVILMALFDPCLYFLLESAALVRTTSHQAGIVSALCPVLVGLIAHFYLKEKLTISRTVGLLLSTLGVVLLFSIAGSVGGAPNPLVGNLFELAAVFSLSGYIVTIRKLALRYDPVVLTTSQMAIGTLFFLPFLFVSGGAFPETLSLSAVLAVLYLGVGLTVVGYVSYNYGSSKVRAGQTSVYYNMVPMINSVLSILILGESITLVQVIASGIILIGVFVSQKS